MDKFSAEGSFSYGSFDSKSLFGAANVPAASELAVRVSGYVSDTDGWITNSFNGKSLRARKEYGARVAVLRSEEHTSELQSLMRISYAVFCLKKKKQLAIIFASAVYARRIAYSLLDVTNSHNEISFYYHTYETATEYPS